MAEGESQGVVFGLGVLDVSVLLAAVVVVGLIVRRLVFGSKKKEDDQLKALQINPM